jgi:hypothetical protein
MYPRYTYPSLGVLGLAFNVFFGGHRSFRADSKRCIERLTPQGRCAEPPLRVLGDDNIPQSGPCLITFNHYFRPGFGAWWLALAIAAVVPVEMHWIMTGELTYPGKWYAPLGMAGSRWLLSRFGKIYGHTTMPPMPPRPQDMETRARAVREMLSYVKEHPHAILGLAPEGGDQPGGRLSWPAAGVGRFGLLLASRGLRFVPVGAYEAEGALSLSFGPAYRLGAAHRVGAAHELSVLRGLSPDEKDRQAAKVIMEHIARQLPSHLRGDFAATDEKDEHR